MMSETGRTTGMSAQRGPGAETFTATEATAILAMMYSAPIVFAPIYMFHVAGPSAWVSGLLSGLAGAVVVYLWVALSASFPGRTLPEFVPEITGRWLGWLINFIFGVYFCYEVAVSTRMTAEVVRQVLPTTPMTVLVAMTLIAAAVVARWGPVVLGRMAIIHFAVISASFIGMALGLFPLIEFGNFLPVLTEGWPAVISAASRPASLFGHIILIAFFLPMMQGASQLHDGVRADFASGKQGTPSSHVRNYFHEGLQVGMTGIGFAWVCFFVLLLFEQGVFSAPEAARLAMPALAAARAIDIGPFFERVEVVLLATWLPAVLIKTSIFLYVAAVTVGHLTAASYRAFVVPVAGLALPASYSLANNLPQLVELINGAWTAVAIGVKVALPLLLLAIRVIQRRLGAVD